MPEMIAGGQRLLSFWSFVLSIMPITAPVCANVVPNIATRIVSPGPVPCWNAAKFIIASGTRAQCKPNITRICQKKPMSKPQAIGLKLDTAVKNVERAVESNEDTGPITQNVKQEDTMSVMSGTAKILIAFGT